MQETPDSGQPQEKLPWRRRWRQSFAGKWERYRMPAPREPTSPTQCTCSATSFSGGAIDRQGGRERPVAGWKEARRLLSLLRTHTQTQRSARKGPRPYLSFRIHGRKGGVRVDGRLMTTPKLIGIPPHVATLTSADELCNLGRLRRLTVWLCRNANKWLARAGETGAGVVVMVRHCSLAWSVDGVPFWTSPSPPHLELDFRCRPSSLCSGQRGRGRICVNGSTLCVLAFCA